MMRNLLLGVVAALVLGIAVPATGSADSTSCDEPSCVPGIQGGVDIGAPCGDTAYYVFGTNSRGRLVFCGSPRRYAPRYFRSLPLIGVRLENSVCIGHEYDYAQAPDGLFLACVPEDGQALWRRGDA